MMFHYVYSQKIEISKDVYLRLLTNNYAMMFVETFWLHATESDSH